MDIKQAAEDLYRAEAERCQIAPFTDETPDLSIKDAYAIQFENVERRRDQGETVAGMKIGLTSAALRKEKGIDSPDFGHLMDRMQILEGDPCPMGELIQPKVEPELAFCMKRALRGPGVTVADVYNAVEYVVPALEIVDSRIADWRTRLADTVADNASAARFIVGGRMTPIQKVDMRLTGMIFERNGELLGTAAAAAVFGNPAAAVAWLANHLAAYDVDLEEGAIVLSGSMLGAVSARAGDMFCASFCGMGSVSLRFE